ncbi:MAG: Hsp20/alpha crystallin family protein [Cytophagaceae bacterium]
MSIVKWNDFNRFPVFQGLLDNFINADASDLLGTLEGNVPMVNIRESKDDFKIEMAVPGLDKENISIKIEKGRLVVAGSSEAKSDEKEHKYHRREYSYKSFQRSFQLPEIIDLDKIGAGMDKGILTITLPKKDEVKKQQEVKTISIS